MKTDVSATPLTSLHYGQPKIIPPKILPTFRVHTKAKAEYESDYSHIYGRLPVPTRGFRQYPPPRGQIYVSEWE